MPNIQIVRQLFEHILKLHCKLKKPTASEGFEMSEIHTFWFLIIAIVSAIIIGRLGTVLREQIEKANHNKLR